MRSDRSIAVLLTVSSGVLYTLAFPPLSASLLAWIALTPFYLAMTRITPREAFLLGGVWSITSAYGVAGFLPEMVSGFLGTSGWVGWAAFGAVVATLSLLYGGYAAWLSWLTRRRAASALLAAAGWGLCEYTRASLIPSGGWALIAYSQAPLERLIQSADLAGPYGLGMLLAATSFCLAAALSKKLRGRYAATNAWAVLGIVVAVCVYGDWRLGQPFGSGPAVPVALVQGGLDREQRSLPERREANLSRYLELTKQASQEHPDLIFWPEFAVDFYLREESVQRRDLFEAARASGADLVLGGPHYRLRTSPPRYFNSVFLIREGRFAGRYDKTALLPFAESNPIQRLLPRDAPYSPGQSLRPLETSTLQVGAFLCSETLDPNVARSLAKAGADLLANPANDDWFGSAVPAAIHLRTAALRAIENRRYLVRATATGYSAIVDPHGRVAARSGMGEAEVLVGPVRASRSVTVYQRLGNAPVGLALVLATAATWRGLKPSNRGRR
jgi:apolipoprotein N-acyltransferase